ncbi:biotin synthase BioB [Francisellaceae bacterium]|nr:biotin synthase BioB [Francisellaceae bacterium]
MKNHQEIMNIFDSPFLDLISKSRAVHVENFKPNSIELCTLLSIKTGACPEDCSYCPQSGHYNTGLEREKLFSVDVVKSMAEKAKKNGAKRFCMGAAWKNPPKKDFPKVLEMVKEVKALGLEACVTLGSIDKEQAKQLKEYGLDYYNHNIDTSERYYEKIITTRTFQERFETLKLVDEENIHTCCGGIIGMGETKEDRIEFISALQKLSNPPKSIPINKLIPIKGTPLADVDPIDNFEFVRTIATIRIIFPKSMIRLSAGREDMTDELQSLCFLAGVNSIFYGDELLTAKNPDGDRDSKLIEKLGLEASKESLYV